MEWRRQGCLGVQSEKMLSANLDLVLEPRLIADVSWYEGVSKLYVDKQGCEFLSLFSDIRQGLHTREEL